MWGSDGKAPFIFNIGAACRVGRGGRTALQAGRLRVRFEMLSLELLIDIILLGALCPWSSTQPVTEMSTRDDSWGVKAAGAYGWPYHFHVPTVQKFWDSQSPVQACRSIPLPCLPNGGKRQLTSTGRFPPKESDPQDRSKIFWWTRSPAHAWAIQPLVYVTMKIGEKSKLQKYMLRLLINIFVI